MTLEGILRLAGTHRPREYPKRAESQGRAAKKSRQTNNTSVLLSVRRSLFTETHACCSLMGHQCGSKRKRETGNAVSGVERATNPTAPGSETPQRRASYGQGVAGGSRMVGRDLQLDRAVLRTAGVLL